MKIKGFLILAFWFSFGYLQAQKDFRPGYIIDNQGDTAYGAIDYRGELLMGQTCTFKANDNTIATLTPDQIFAFRFIDSKYFISKEVNGRKVFLEYLIKGKVNIYYLKDDKGEHYYIAKDDSELTEIPYKEEVRYIDGVHYLDKSKIHIGLLNYYMQDAPDLQPKIAKIEKPEHQNMINIAEAYNLEVCPGEKCIIYQKKEPFMKVNLEAVFGMIHFTESEDFVKNDYFHTGVLAHFWMPRLNEKVFFKTGYLYSPAIENDEGESFAYLQVPFHVGYLAPNSYLVRPFASISLFSPSYCGGVMIRVYKKINVGVESWVNCDYEKLPWIPSNLINYSILANIYFAF